MQDAKKLFVETPQATLDPADMPTLPGVQAANFFEDIGAFVQDDVITPVLGIGTGTITTVAAPIGDALGDLGGILGTTVGSVTESIGGIAGDLTGSIIGKPLLIIGAIIGAIILVIVLLRRAAQ